MHEGDHGIMDQTHDELDKKFGHSESEYYSDHHHNHRPQSSDRLIKISASIVVILLIGLFVVYKFL